MSSNYLSQITVPNQSINLRIHDLHLDGTIITNANSDIKPSFSVTFTHSSGPTENQTKLMSRNVRVVGATVIMTSVGVSALDTVQVRNGLDAITENMNIGSPKPTGTVVHNTTINPSHWNISAGQNLAVQFYGDTGSSATCVCIVDLLLL